MKVNFVHGIKIFVIVLQKAKTDNWMKNSAQDKMEQARIAREREMEALMVARSHAIEEEEMERAAEEAERRSGKCI